MVSSAIESHHEVMGIIKSSGNCLYFRVLMWNTTGIQLQRRQPIPEFQFLFDSIWCLGRMVPPNQKQIYLICFLYMNVSQEAHTQVNVHTTFSKVYQLSLLKPLLYSALPYPVLISSAALVPILPSSHLCSGFTHIVFLSLWAPYKQKIKKTCPIYNGFFVFSISK